MKTLIEQAHVLSLENVDLNKTVQEVLMTRFLHN